MNKGDVYFRGRPCSVHLKIGFAAAEMGGKEGRKRGGNAGKL